MTLSVFVGATAPVERDTSPGEERPDWVDENTCEIEFFAGLPLPLEAVDTWCYYCGAPFDQFTIFTFCPLCREHYCPECVDDASRHGFFCRDSFGVRVCLHTPLTWGPLAWASASRAPVAGQKLKWDLLVVVV